MKKILVTQTCTLCLLICAFPVYAQTADVVKVQSFIQNIIQVLVTLSGLIAAGFFVWGGLGYITSSGNPESLNSSWSQQFNATGKIPGCKENTNVLTNGSVRKSVIG
jgi:hypothetical protein